MDPPGPPHPAHRSPDDGTFFSTMPVGEVPTLIRPRPSPWDPGWGRRNPAPMPTMMRSRGPQQRASTYQYMAPHLLYRIDAN